jgi:glycosyltransferase involved in cell wall biosynthesis
MRIGCVSDVCLGYGSPQIVYLVESLIQVYPSAEILIVEPAVPGQPPRHNRFPHLRIRRAATGFRPYSEYGRTEYMLAASRLLNKWAPDLLLICCTFTLPVLFKLTKRPAQVIYYSYESIPHYGEFDVEMNRWLKGLIDVVIFPEENRAALEIGRFGFGDIPALVLYNCPKKHDRRTLPKVLRNGRYLYSGLIDRTETLAEYFTRPEVQIYPIDLYGPIRGSKEECAHYRSQVQGRVRYHGIVDRESLDQIRRSYIYSLVMWNPHRENQFYAAPNKFFESIADGVPPLSAPHPQCQLFIEQYECGLLLKDWSESAMVTGLQTANRIYGTSQWEAMVERCEMAFRQELNWERQFEKLKVHLTK